MGELLFEICSSCSRTHHFFDNIKFQSQLMVNVLLVNFLGILLSVIVP